MSDCLRHQSMTMLEMAQEAYLAAVAGDDDRKDDPRLDEAIHLMGDLWERLRPLACEAVGCREPRMPSFPWCPLHEEAVLRQRKEELDG